MMRYPVAPPSVLAGYALEVLFKMKALMISLVALSSLAACNPNSIGRLCVNPQGSDVRGTQISSPALECPSRLCLIQPITNAGPNAPDGGVRPICTAECGNDGDCTPETTEYCSSGFVCAVAATVGNFCCRKICICKDDLQLNVNKDADGGVMLPPSCDPATYVGTNMEPQCRFVH